MQPQCAFPRGMNGRFKTAIVRRFLPALAGAFSIAMLTCVAVVGAAPSEGPYQILMTAKVGGEGGFDYIFADAEDRRLYIPRRGPKGGVTIFNLDSLEPVGKIDGLDSGGAVVDHKSHHGFSTTKPITLWDSNTLKVIKTITVDGHPDGIMLDRYNERVWVFSHEQPHATVIDARDGTVVGVLDLGGAPEQAASDGTGKVYVNIVDPAAIAVIDANTLSVAARYDLSSRVSGGSGLALDAKNHVLFAYYRLPSPTVVIVNADSGNVITALPTGTGVDTVVFDPATMESISAENAGSMTFIMENSPTSFSVKQSLQTKSGAKALALDTKTNHVLTMTADFEPPTPNAPPRAAGRPPRGPMVPGSFSILMVGKP